MNDWKKNFAIIMSGQLFSIIGSAAAQIALIWYLSVKTNSPMVLAAAGVCGFLPQALFGAFAGAWIDRLKRKHVMIAADLFIAFVSFLLLIYTFYAPPPVWVVLMALFFRSVGSVFHAPALQATLPLIVPKEYIEKLSGWNQFIMSGANMIAPMLGTLLITVFSLGAVMLVDIAGAVLSCTTLLFVTIKDPEPTPRQQILKEMLLGLEEIRKNSVLLKMSLPVFAAVLFFLPVNSFFPLMISGYFGKDAYYLGIVEVMFSVGLLVSSLLVGFFGGLKNKFLQMSLSMAALGIFLFLSGILPPTGFVLFAILSALMGFSGSYFSLAYVVHIQTSVAPQVMGRVFAITGSLMSLATPIGLFLAAPLATMTGVAAWFSISGFFILLSGVAGVIMAVRIRGAK